jgi:hypothetical protein
VRWSLYCLCDDIIINGVYILRLLQRLCKLVTSRNMISEAPSHCPVSLPHQPFFCCPPSSGALSS